MHGQQPVRTAEVRRRLGGLRPRKLTRKVLAAFEAFRKEMPPEIGLGVDVHSLLDPIRGLQFGKDVEPFRLFYL